MSMQEIIPQPDKGRGMDFLILRCPTDLPIEERAACFFNNGSGNCEKCTYLLFRQKILIDETPRNRWEMAAGGAY